MLAHRLYRSGRTGEVISDRFTQLTYPWHRHDAVLRDRDYLRVTPASRWNTLRMLRVLRGRSEAF